jgi:molybdenum cofactor cytidylyltransferase
MTRAAPPIGVAALLLAAGNSSRMGRPKQLLDYHGRPLLRRVAETALAAKLSPVVIVLGAWAAEIRPTLAGLAVDVLENPDWPRGMGTTLRVGITHLLQTPTPPTAVLLMLCDQPLVGPDHLAALIAEHEHTGKPLVAAAYEGTYGVPALVGQFYFEELQNLPAAAGAKLIFARHPRDLATVPIPEAAFDVDDPDAYEQLLQRP